MKLKNRTAVITGASQGLGFEIAKVFLREGAQIMICARDKNLLIKAHQELSHFTNNPSHIFSETADVSQPNDVKNMITSALHHFGQIDILVANAGIYGPKGSLDTIDFNAWSDTIDINLKGSMLPCQAVLPHFKQKNYGKIILLSGGGATKPLPYLSAYAASKAAVVRFGETLAEEVRPYHIDVNSVAPGALNTRLLEEILNAGPEKVGEAFYQQSLKQKATGGADIQKAAALCVYLASAESDGVTGKLISALWDPWDKLHSRLGELTQSDIYTLRRIDKDQEPRGS